MMKRFVGFLLLGAFLLLSLATMASAYTYSPYGQVYGYYYGAGGYPSYNFHPYTYGPGGWSQYGPYYHGGYLYPHQGNFYGYGYYGGGYGGNYYYRGYNAPWYYNYWPYSYRVYQRTYP